MQKNKGWTFVNDLDVLGDIGEDTDTSSSIDNAVEDVDVFGKSEPEEAPEVITQEKEPEPKVEETKAEEPKIEEPKPQEGEDLDKRVEDLLKSSAEVDDKAEEVKAAADESGDENLIKLVDELQSAMAEKNLQLQELQKQVEVSNNRYLTKFGEEEELSMYKPEIEKLQNNPRLMAFVKYYDSDNEKLKPKMVAIASDFIYKLTGQDVSELLETKDTKALESVLSNPGNDSSISIPEKKEDDKNLDYEESINNLF